MIAQKSNLGDIVFWCTIFIAALVVFVVFVAWIRRFLLRDAAKSPSRDALSLQQLRELRQNGDITEDEFQVLKSQVIAQFKPTGENDSD